MDVVVLVALVGMHFSIGAFLNALVGEENPWVAIAGVWLWPVLCIAGLVYLLVGQARIPASVSRESEGE